MVSCRELMPAVTVLQLFLSSSKPVLRFAAVRTLNRVAQTHPMSVTNCNIDMESLISDQNRSIATLAITTLLKTGTRRELCQAPPLPVDISCLSASCGAKALELIELKCVHTAKAHIACCCIGNEGSVDRLLKQIATFMSDIADEFKIVVVEAIRSLCLKFPAKHRALMNFLSNVLREVPDMLPQ